MIDALIDRYHQRDRLALARLLTHVAEGEHLESIDTHLCGHTDGTDGRARVIAVTGNSGVGKSTLVGTLTEQLRGDDKSVAVLACDPQSSLTGGALLGDRVRMPSRPDDDGVFVRSLATESGHQAVAARLDIMIRLLDSFGFDVVLLETVGAGQGDTAVRDLCDVVVLLLQPEIGDELQWEKAGILEIADIVVIHKGDLPGAEATEAQVRDLLNLPGCRSIPVTRASAREGTGLRELWALIESCARDE